MTVRELINELQELIEDRPNLEMLPVCIDAGMFDINGITLKLADTLNAYVELTK